MSDIPGARLHPGAGRATVLSMRRLWLSVVMLLAGAVGLWIVNGTRTREPLFEGKPLDQWLDAGYEDASRALYEVGSNAVPGIFAKLNREDPDCGRWGRYRTVWGRFPAICRQVLPRPRVSGFDEWRACNALLAIGPRAVPALTVALRDRHFLVRSASARTLGLFRQRGCDIRAAMPALEAALHDSDFKVREHAAAALGITTRTDAAAGNR